MSIPTTFPASRWLGFERLLNRCRPQTVLGKPGPYSNILLLLFRVGGSRRPPLQE
jgi:hypothetical protein